MAPNKKLYEAAKNAININPHHESLHSVLGIPESNKIPMARIKQAENSPDPKIRKKAQFADNARGFSH